MSRRFLPSLRRVERKDAVDRRHSAGPNYAFAGAPYMPVTDLDLDRVIRDQWERDVWVWRSVDARAKNAASIDVLVKNARGPKGEPIPNHPIASLLNAMANPYEPALSFRWRLQMLLDLSVTRGVPVEVTENRMGPARFDILNPLHTYPVPHPEKFIERWEMRLPNGEVFDELKPYEYGKGGVLWFKRPHPTDPYQSTSWLKAAGISVDLDYWARRYNLNFLFNDGRPGGVLAVKSGAESEYDGIDPADAAVLQQRMSGGPDAAGRVTILEADHLEYIDLSQSPRDAQYVEGRAITQREILVAAGTPLSVIGDASGRTFDNADAEGEQFWKKEMKPELRLQANTWEQLTPGGLRDEREVVDYDWTQVPELARDQRLRDARLLDEVRQGVRSIDSYLEATGREVLNLPGTRVLWFDSGKAPIGDPDDVNALLTQGQAPAPLPPGAPPELPPGDEPPAIGPAPGNAVEPDDVVDAELVDPLDEAQYAVKALRGLPSGLAQRRRAAHAALIDRWTEATAAEVRGLLERQRKVVLSRLKGAKARRHTRHWDYGPVGPRHELKALDPTYIVERRTWIDQAIDAIVEIVQAAFGAAGEATAKQLAVTYEAAAEATRNEVIARTVRLIAEGLDARAGRLQDIIAELDADGASVDEIADAVTEAYGSVDTWAEVTSRSVVGAMNAASLLTATRAGAVAKRWLATDDERTRKTHHDAEGQVVPIGSPFRVGEAELAFPHDPSGPPGEVINCRCTMLFALGKPDADADLDEDLAELDAAEAEWKARAPGSFARFNVSFDPDEHPRDYRGRFIDVPDVLLPDGTEGVAVSQDSRGNVVVARSDGGVETINPDRLEVIIPAPSAARTPASELPGNVEIVYADGVELTPEQRARFERTVADVAGRAGATDPVRIQVETGRVSGGITAAMVTSGATLRWKGDTVRGNLIRVPQATIRQPDFGEGSKPNESAFTEDRLRFRLAHEFGHVFANENEHTLKGKAEIAFWQSQQDGLSGYGQRDRHEAYGEAFAQHMLGQHLDDEFTTAANAYAERYGWPSVDVPEPSPVRSPSLEPPATDTDLPAQRRGLVADIAALPGYLTSYLKTVVAGAVHPVEHGSPEHHLALQQMAAMFQSPADTPERWQLVELPNGTYGQVASAPDAQGRVDIVGLPGGATDRQPLADLTPAGPPPYLTHFDRDAERHVWCADGHRHWGAAGAAGVLVRNVDEEDGTVRYLLQLRSPGVQWGNTWSTPGGAMHLGERPEDAGLREALEELGDVPGEVEVGDVFTDEHGGWAYHTVVLDSPTRFRTRNADREGLGTGWFTADEIARLRLHPSFKQSWPALRARVEGTDEVSLDLPHPEAASVLAPMFSDLAEPMAATAAVRAAIAEGRDKRGSAVPVGDMNMALAAMLARAGIPYDADPLPPSALAGEHAAKSGQTGDGAKARTMIPTVEQLIDNGVWRKAKVADLAPGQRVEVTTTGDHGVGEVASVEDGVLRLTLGGGVAWETPMTAVTEARVHADLTPEEAAKEWKRQYNAARFRVRDARLKALKAADGKVEQDMASAPEAPEKPDPEDVEAVIDTLAAHVTADMAGDSKKPKALYTLQKEQVSALIAAGKDIPPGHVSPWASWHNLSAVKLLEDGDSIPVRNMLIQGYLVEHGTVFKLPDTPPILVEHAFGEEATTDAAGNAVAPALLRAQAAARAWGRASKNVKPELKDLQRGFSLLLGANPADKHWEQKYGISNFTSAATGGDRGTAIWNGLDATVGTVAHEFGHNVDRHAASHGPLTGAMVLPEPPASADEGMVQTALTFAKVRETDQEVGEWWSSLLKDEGREFVEARKAPGDHTIMLGNTEADATGIGGVPTDYGRASVAEDFAESVRLYLKDRTLGRLGYLTPKAGETQGPVLRFADMYPERARYLDTVFGNAPVTDTAWQKRQTQAIIDTLKATSKNDPDWQAAPDLTWPSTADLSQSFAVEPSVVNAARSRALTELAAEIKEAKAKAAAEQAAINAKLAAEKAKQEELESKAKAAAEALAKALDEAAAAPATVTPADPDAVKKIRKRKAWIKWNAKQDKLVPVPSTADGYIAVDLMASDKKGELLVKKNGLIQFQLRSDDPPVNYRMVAANGMKLEDGTWALVPNGALTRQNEKGEWVNTDVYTQAVPLADFVPNSIHAVAKQGMTEATAQLVADNWETEALAELAAGKEEASGLPGAPPAVAGLSDKQVGEIIAGAQDAYEQAKSGTWATVNLEDIVMEALSEAGTGDPVTEMEARLGGRTVRLFNGADNFTVTGVTLADTGDDVALTMQGDTADASPFTYLAGDLGSLKVLSGGTEQDALAARQDYIVNAVIQALASPESSGYHGAPSSEEFSNANRRKAGTWLNKAKTATHPLAQTAGYYGNAEKAKSAIAAELASRLNNEDDWERFREYRKALHGVGTADKYGHVPYEVPAWADTTTEQRQKLLDQEVSNRVGNWASTSADSSPWSVCMQRAVAEEFATGGDWNPHGMSMSYPIGNSTIAETWDQGLGAFYRRFVRVMYENTQEKFAAEKVTHVSLYRGMKGGDGKPHSWAQIGTHEVTDLMPVNSWSSSRSIAGNFGGDYSGGRMLVADFPVERILGSARTGFGCLNEYEFVVLNGPGNVTVYQGGSPSIPAGK